MRNGNVVMPSRSDGCSGAEPQVALGNASCRLLDVDALEGTFGAPGLRRRALRRYCSRPARTARRSAHPAACVAASADLEIAAKSFPKYVGCRGVVRSRALIERPPEFRVEAHRQ